MKVAPSVAAPGAIIAGIASRQFGVVTRKQLLAAGLGGRSIDHRLATGKLEPLGRGIYRVAGSARCWEQLALAAQLTLGDGATLSHTSAARVWGLATPRPKIVEVSVAMSSHHSSREGVVVHRARQLEGRDRTRRGMFRVTTVARTLVDLAARLDSASLSRVVDDAVCRTLVTPVALSRTADRLRARGRRGSGTFREVVEPWLGETVPDSVAEMAFLRMVADARLPPPVCQYEVFDRGRFVARPDFVWSDQMVALQVDGYRWHSSPAAFAKDSRQTNELIALGWAVLHVTPLEIRDSPSRVLGAVRRALAGRA
jgi:hypothetical protein